MIFFVSSNVNANEICYDILKYEKENVCPKAKDAGKCLKEAYLEYNKCIENLKNSASPAKIEKAAEEARKEEARKEEAREDEKEALKRRCYKTYDKYSGRQCNSLCSGDGGKSCIRCMKKSIRKLKELSSQCPEFSHYDFMFGDLEDRIESLERDLDRAIDRARRAGLL